MLRIIANILVLVLPMLLLGCGTARKPGGEGHDLSRHRFDQNLKLELTEIISGEVGNIMLSDPVSIALTADGELVVLERMSRQLLVLDTNRQVVRKSSGAGRAAGEMSEPRFVRSGFGLSLNVSDRGGRLVIFDSQLRFIESFEPAYEASGFGGGSPSGLAVAASGDTYLADGDNDVVYRFDAGGRYVATIGGPETGPGRLNRPEGLAVTDDGRLIVCDTGGQRLVVFDDAGEYLVSLGEGELHHPVAAAVTPDQRAVFICDKDDPRLTLYSLEGWFLSSWDGYQLLPEGFGELTDVMVAGSSLYIADAGNRRVLKFHMIPAAD